MPGIMEFELGSTGESKPRPAESSPFVMLVLGNFSGNACKERCSAEAILGRGIMPVVSFRNRDMARLLRVQLIAKPLAALAGPW